MKQQTATKPLLNMSLPSVPSKKRVCFSKTPPSQHSIPLVDENCREDVWWSRAELKRFKTKARSQVSSGSTNCLSLIDCLHKVHKLAGRVASKISQEDRLYGVLQSVPIGESLSVWCCASLLRGLERPIRRCDLSSSVDYMRAVVKWQGTVNAEELRQVSLFLTREDRVFARMLGQGDAYAVEASQTIVSTKLEAPTISLAKSLQGRETTMLQRKVMAQQA